ncbi:MAG: hypothetical protein BWY84_00209 [Candidatus Aerophobetes bacterium ADurb.Bin490]|nr:MAG: hypothetical protein BWY84_00209 [Candidatus Aerophobetes bacterium ADurb.Bin490]
MPVVSTLIDRAPSYLSAVEFVRVAVEPPPDSEVSGFESAPVSKSSNIPAATVGVGVNVGIEGSHVYVCVGVG